MTTYVIQLKQKVSIKFSLMPENVSNLLEHKTGSILERIQAVNRF